MPLSSGQTTDQDQRRVTPNTGFTNFQSYWTGNQAAANRTANQIAGTARQLNQQSDTALGQTQQDFNRDVGAGSVSAPPGSTNVGSGSASQSGVQGMRANTLDQAGNSTSGGTNNGTNAVTQAQARANAQKAYTGPLGLSNESSYGNAAATAQRAQDWTNAIDPSKGGNVQALVQSQNPNAGFGASLLSSALTGAAGGQVFDTLRRQFAPELKLQKAETASEQAGQQAQTDSNTNAGLWQQFADNYDNSMAAPQPSTSNNGVPAIPDSVTTVDQAVADGYSPDQIVAKFGYGAYSDSVNAAFNRGK